jgi:hypothetical protein
VVVTPTIVQSNGITTITFDQLTPGVQTNTLVYSTSAGHFTNTWTFTETVSSTTPIDGITLSTNLWTPPGSGSNPGFALKVYQAPNTNIFNGWQTIARMADMALHGLYEVNVADLTEFTNNGALWVTNGVINYASNDPTPATPPGAGNFQASTFPDALFPGLGLYTPPNSTYFTNGTTTMNYSAMEVKAFLEFASPGYYVMGVNSDDGFRVTEGDQGAPDLTGFSVLAPASIAGAYVSMYTTTADEGGNNGFGVTPPSTVPLIGRAVLANPPNATSIGGLLNASAMVGNVAVVVHNGNFQTQARMAAAAGAIAVICANNSGDVPYPGTRGAADANKDPFMPCVSTSYAAYQALTNAITQDASSPVIVRLTAQDCSPILGKIDETKGSSDVLFGITVPAAGVYPFRLIWDNGNGGCNLEWFVRDLVLGTYLVNEPGSPVKAWITRDVHAAGALPAPRLNDAYVSGGNVVISWTGQGELWEAYSIHGPWFKSTYQANPSAVVLNPFLPVRYFRVRQY